MKCWKCGEKIDTNKQPCPYCRTAQKRNEPKTEIGRTFRYVCDKYSCDAIFNDGSLLFSNINNYPDIQEQLKEFCDAGVYINYKTQLSYGYSDDKFRSKIKNDVQKCSSYLSDKDIDTLMLFFDEMIGWDILPAENIQKMSETGTQQTSGYFYQSNYENQVPQWEGLYGYTEDADYVSQNEQQIKDLQIKQYQDSLYQSGIIKMNAEKYEEALIIWGKLSGYSNANYLNTLCRGKIKESQKIEYKKILIQSAGSKMKEGKFAEALMILERLSGNKKVEPLIALCREKIKESNLVAYNQRLYQSAISKMDEGKYVYALSILENLSGIDNIDARINECRQKIKESQEKQYKETLYQSAITKMHEGKYEEAHAIFSNLSGYNNADDLVYQCRKERKKKKYAKILRFLLFIAIYFVINYLYIGKYL